MGEDGLLAAIFSLLSYEMSAAEYTGVRGSTGRNRLIMQATWRRADRTPSSQITLLTLWRDFFEMTKQ